ncbi:hypothetical protein N0V83_007962 [Neocucurbitaria cava]|uniref:Uncharacterized protein n=1 Tax=Neocucurbitaria cava TaxID=798079 RepID=A0A9W8Y456_9PLEO|nr:hypothetical protein N0V83_007962 [Neocucurbitaria cava]
MEHSLSGPVPSSNSDYTFESETASSQTVPLDSFLEASFGTIQSKSLQSNPENESSESETVALDVSESKPFLEPVRVLEAIQKARDRTTDYLYLSSFSYLTLIDAIYRKEMEDAPAVETEEDRIKWRENLWQLLASIPDSILRCCLDGSLAYKHRSHDALICKYYGAKPDNPWHIESLKTFAPAIYVRPLVNERGESPTPNMILTIFGHLQAYASGTDIKTGLSIDNALKEGTSTFHDIKRGHHAYIDQKPARAEVVYTWCAAVVKICEKVSYRGRDLPLSQPLTYCGYTETVSACSKQYENCQSTTWLVSLVTAAFRAYYPDHNYNLGMYAVAFIAVASEASLRERALTRCTYSDYKYGGFCVVTPGSCSSAELLGLTEQARHQTWAERLRWREVDNEDFEHNVCREAHRLRTSPFITMPRMERQLQRRYAELDAIFLELEDLAKELAAL